MRTVPKNPTKSQFKSLLQKVAKLDDDAVITMDVLESGWSAMSKGAKIRLYKDYLKRLEQQSGPKYRVFNPDGSPNMD